MNKRLAASGFGAVGILLVVATVALVSLTGWIVYNGMMVAKPSAPQPVTASQAGWKTYTSKLEKLSFRYPSTWATEPGQSNSPDFDTLIMKSPSGKLDVSWVSAISGLGGDCDATAAPGTTDTACPYWSVLDKQKLAGASLYYVAGVMTRDGKAYQPWCALQAPDGVVTSQSNVGYLLFMGKNNRYIQDGHDYGTQSAGLLCSIIPHANGGGSFDGVVSGVSGTRAQAEAYLSDAEFQRAKQILLSASY